MTIIVILTPVFPRELITMRVTTKGQVATPQAIREKHRSTPHSKVRYVEDNKGVYLQGVYLEGL